MKFTDGFRLMRDGVRVSCATEVRETHHGPDFALRGGSRSSRRGGRCG